jgi:mRNA interferase MazF
VVEVTQGDVWWADLPEPTGSGPGFRRPVVIVQGNPLNRSRLATVVCVPLTSNILWADAPGNVLLPAKATGLSKDSVANVTQITALDRSLLTERTKHLGPKHVAQILHGIDVMLGR